MPDKHKGPIRVGILGRGRSGLDIHANWFSQVPRKCRIVAVAVRGSDLVVRVEDPAWASQLGWLEQQLLTRVEALVGPGRITSVTARVVPRDTP